MLYRGCIGACSSICPCAPRPWNSAFPLGDGRGGLRSRLHTAGLAAALASGPCVCAPHGVGVHGVVAGGLAQRACRPARGAARCTATSGQRWGATRHRAPCSRLSPGARVLAGTLGNLRQPRNRDARLSTRNVRRPRWCASACPSSGSSSPQRRARCARACPGWLGVHRQVCRWTRRPFTGSSRHGAMATRRARRTLGSTSTVPRRTPCRRS